ncbi:MAG: DUF983 domain-containing protein [Mucilaginibacter sp.]|uniref:DUF983 domain-containing protein n=1 Tax=Mucilaginibacter sp. TaxID=1882438 RepID=UPI0031A83403
MEDDKKYIDHNLKAALHARCPRCRRGAMFANSPLSLFNQKMNNQCPHCGFFFEIEPGYFYVAMFVSYAINVAIMVSFAVATYVLTHNNNPWLYVGATLLPAVIFSPFTYRYSRVILLYWLTPGIHFDPKRAEDDYHYSR